MNTETKFPPSANPQVLQAFSRALGRESHILTQHPDLLWQQMYNRLQWEEKTAGQLASTIKNHRVADSSPWIKLKTHLRESEALVRTFEGHQKSITSIAHSPDGCFIASISHDHTLRVWEVATGQISWVLSLEKKPISTVSFSPDGKFLACATIEGKLHLYDALTGLFLAKLSISDFVLAYTFSADWRLLVTPSSNGQLHIWEVSSGKLLKTLSGHTADVLSLAISPDGQSLVSAGYDESELLVWNTNTSHLRIRLKGHQKQVLACAFSPDGCLIASTSEDNTLRLWDAASGTELWLQGSITNPYWCAFSPDGSYIGSSFFGNALRIWDTHTGAPVCTFDGHSNSVQAGTFLPDGHHIISASNDNTLRLWKISPNQDQNREVEGFGSARTCIYSPDGSWIYSLESANVFPDNSVHLTDAGTGELVRELVRSDESPFAALKAYALSPDGRTIVSHHIGDNTLKIWEVATGQTLQQLSGHTKGVTTCAFSPNGRYIISGGLDCSLRHWHAASGRARHTMRNHKGCINACTFSPDGCLILSGSDDGDLRVWKAKSGKTLRILKGHLEAVQAGVFSPDGLMILSASQDKTLRLWQSDTGRLLQILEGHTAKVTDCSISPDGSLAVSVSQDKSLRVWSITRGEEIADIIFPSVLLTLGMHPYKPELVCGGEGGILYRMELIEYTYMPIIVTARKKLTGKEVFCPSCQAHHPIAESQLGTELTCPSPGCGLRLKVNPFVIHML